MTETNARRIIVYSRDEYKQSEMRGQVKDERLRFWLGDVRSLDRLHRAFNGVDRVVHAAALKQVPTLEVNPTEAVATNVLGSCNVIEAALDCGVQQVLGISTDKAVNPINLYGATKLVMEKVLLAANDYGGHSTRFSVVRYGNVMGSRGSVIPLFQKCRERHTGTVPITDPGMTRFWMTLDQAADLVMLCLERARGGEIFVPRVPSATIEQLARAVYPDAEMAPIGVRPGEKLHEILVGEDREHVLMVDLDDMSRPVQPADRPLLSQENDRWLSLDSIQSMIASSLGPPTGAPNPTVV